MTESQMEEIVTRVLVYGETPKNVADSLGMTSQAINSLLRTFELVRAQNWDTICERLRKNTSALPHVKWAAKKFYYDIPANLMKRMEEAYSDYAKWRKEMIGPAVTIESEHVLCEKPLDNTALCMCKVLELLAKQNELLEQLMDVVLPKYVSDIKDNVNANADVLCDHLKTCEQAMEKIVCNTRKRGL